VRIVMPPLRQRPEDMELIVRKLLRNLGRAESSSRASARRSSWRASRDRRGPATSASCGTISSAAWCSRSRCRWARIRSARRLWCRLVWRRRRRARRTRSIPAVGYADARRQA
jgi:hypothetical protein